VKDEEEVKQNWEKLKEGKKSVLEGVQKFTGLSQSQPNTG
jgi:hypothetical protein